MQHGWTDTAAPGARRRRRASIRELLRLHLDLAVFTIDEAGEGRSALETARATPFDLVLLDVMLPGLDGISVCRAIRNGGPNVDTPILTDRVDEFTSQLYFPDELTDRVHAAQPYASNRGQRLLNARDMIFREGGTELMLPIVENTGGYAATCRIAMRPGTS